jgi:hypothetical protein
LLRQTYRWEQLEELFGDPAEVKAIYGHWLEYVSRFDIDSHWLVRTDNEPIPQDLREWERIIREWN